MKTIFNTQVIAQFQERIDNISANKKAEWGKMSPFQMVRHCCENERMLLRRKEFKRLFIGRLFGKLALKSNLKDNSPMGKNKPTHPDLKITGDGDLEIEKITWKELLSQYVVSNNTTFNNFTHPFFGKMTKEQIGAFAYKHTDHHLRQFGV